MTYRPEPGGEFERLLLLLVEEELAAEDVERLSQILRQDSNAREYYARYVALHAALEAKQVRPPILLPDGGPGRPAVVSDLLLDERPQPPTKRYQIAAAGKATARYAMKHPLVSVAIAALVLLTALIAKQAIHPNALRQNDRAGAEQKSQFLLATITNVAAARWAGEAPTGTNKDQLPAVYHLLEGSAEITLANRTVLTLEAPCRLELLDPKRALLHEGRVVAYVPDNAVRFVIDTPSTAIEDLGTEFGVGVRPDGETLVQVYTGKVVTMAKAAGAAARRQLTAGQALTVGKTTQDVAFVANRFIRRLPAPSSEDDELTPRNTPKLETLVVPRAAGPVHVDGDLSDWNLAHAFEARCNAVYGDDYHVRGAMMYDNKNLYLAAEVADPSPMRSVVDPALDAEHSFSGGAVQIRLLANRQSRWPSDLRSTHTETGPRGEPVPLNLREQDADERVLHLTMWYFEPRDQACLYVQHGMDYHACSVNPPGCRGAFRKLASGRGYVMEYAVSWESLGLAADPPRAGDVLPATWIVHWSDEGGRSWRGKLVEIHNLSETNRDEFWRAVTWGKAEFLR